MRRLKLPELIAIYVLIVCACNGKRQIPDVSNVKINFSVQRFEQDLLAFDTAHFDAEEQKLQKKYPEFYPVYVSQIMQFKRPFDTIIITDKGPEKKLMRPDAYKLALKTFVSNRAIRALGDTVQHYYADFSQAEEELKHALQYFHFYFPQRQVPGVVTFISEFSYGCATIDSTQLLIGLDMFLGAQYPYYREFFPDYMIQTMKREYICPSAMSALYQWHFQNANTQSNLLYEMIERGKRYYFLDLMCPEAADYTKISYTAAQTDWCEENEEQLWNFFAEHELFYASDAITMSKYLSVGPGVSGMPAEAPGNVGSWIGWQIVRAFAENTNSDLAEVLRANPKLIMKKANYKPKNK